MCVRCGAVKPLSGYYTGDKTCKACRCFLARERRRTNPKVQEYDRKRGNRQTAEDTRKYREANPKKYKATNWVNNAVRDGRLVKLDSCEVCDSTLQVEGHHDDYDQPKIVRWLCSRCHSIWHAENGEALNPF
uniref:Recombinase n=2 Tax=unclassified bacterial viruses TaxID=12333 RepID=A0AAU6VYL5_9VIRU